MIGEGEIISISGEFESGEEWDYYRIELKANPHPQSIFYISSSRVGEFCLGTGGLFKPDECNFDSNGDMICFGTNVIIGVKNLLLNSTIPQPFYFELTAGHPHQSVPCMAEYYYAIFFVFGLTIWLGIIIIITLLLCCTCKERIEEEEEDIEYVVMERRTR